MISLRPSGVVCQAKIHLVAFGPNRPDRTGREATSAGRTNVVQRVFDAIRTVGTLIAANHSVLRCGRQITIT